MFRLQAPAKLNLYLRVLGRRPDGYHELETLFERIDLADELTFEPSEGLTLTCSDPDLSCGEDNLIVQAARLLQEARGGRRKRRAGGARIHLTKRIPIAAGLGGGSSDAAAALRGLHQLWGMRLDQPRLLELAGRLGSDVPFFLTDTPFAIGRGRGERCEPIEDGPALAHVLVVPPVPLSTKEVYEGFAARCDPSTPPPAWLCQAKPVGSLPGPPLVSAGAGRMSPRTRTTGLPLTTPKPSLTMVLHALRNGSLSELATGLWNDLEPEAIRRCPVIASSLSRLREVDCLGVRVSGSGPSVFGLCRDAAHARAAADALRKCSPHPDRVEVILTLPRAAGGAGSIPTSAPAQGRASSAGAAREMSGWRSPTSGWRCAKGRAAAGKHG